MWNGCYVPYRGDLESGRLERADCRLTPRSRSPHQRFYSAKPHRNRLLGRVARYELRDETRALLRPLESDSAGTRPRDRVAFRVGQGDDGVVEARSDVRDSVGLNRLLLALSQAYLPSPASPSCRPSSSYLLLSSLVPSLCARSFSSSDRGTADPACDASRGSNRCPSGA